MNLLYSLYYFVFVRITLDCRYRYVGCCDYAPKGLIECVLLARSDGRDFVCFQHSSLNHAALIDLLLLLLAMLVNFHLHFHLYGCLLHSLLEFDFVSKTYLYCLLQADGSLMLGDFSM